MRAPQFFISLNPSPPMQWIYLLLAIVSEVSATTSMKLSQGFSRPGWVIVIVAGYTASFTFITLALKRIDLGLAYAIWAGIGTAAAALIGITAFHEPCTMLRVVGIILILLGVVTLRFGGVG